MSMGEIVTCEGKPEPHERDYYCLDPREIDDRPIGQMHVCEACGTEWDIGDECPSCLARSQK
jgi:hypothetical protein